MAVYRVNKNRGYTVMANYHLRDKTLSLKAVGLLSKMLSFNDGWQFSTKGLSAICKEGPDAVLAALRELERDAKGRMSNTVFEIYEQPQPVSPHRENPDVDNPDMDNPHMENPHGENPAQLNTNQVINNQRNNSLNKYQSINLDGMDRMDEREQYRELIRDNLEIDIRSQPSDERLPFRHSEHPGISAHGVIQRFADHRQLLFSPRELRFSRERLMRKHS